MSSFSRVTIMLIAFGLVTGMFGILNRVDDDQLVQAVASAVLEQEGAKFHRVTESTFKMSPGTNMLCRAATDSTPHNLHAEFYCHVYVNDQALKPMTSGEGLYPEGSLIIKQKYSDRRGIDTRLFTVMRKMAAGYDTDNNNWEYSIVDAAAITVLSRGRTDSCIKCHDSYSTTDFVTRLYMDRK